MDLLKMHSEKLAKLSMLMIDNKEHVMMHIWVKTK